MNNIDFLHFCTYNTSDNLCKCIEIAKIPLKNSRNFIHWPEMVVGAPLEMILNKKTPEMNELESDKNFLKIWVPNFEKHFFLNSAEKK